MVIFIFESGVERSFLFLSRVRMQLWLYFHPFLDEILQILIGEPFLWAK